MKRRALLAVPTLLGACSVLPKRPYLERRDWPLTATRPAVLPPRPDGPVLLVRGLRAGPGLEARGLRVLQPDGSVRVSVYDEWAVPPAEAVEAALRDWLAASGRFAAVVAPGSLVAPTLVLEGSLDALLAEPDAGRLRAVLSLVAFRPRPSSAPPVPLRLVAEAPLADNQPAAIARAGDAALAVLLTRAEQALPPPEGAPHG